MNAKSDDFPELDDDLTRALYSDYNDPKTMRELAGNHEPWTTDMQPVRSNESKTLKKDVPMGQPLVTKTQLNKAVSDVSQSPYHSLVRVRSIHREYLNKLQQDAVRIEAEHNLRVKQIRQEGETRIRAIHTDIDHLDRELEHLRQKRGQAVQERIDAETQVAADLDNEQNRFNQESAIQRQMIVAQQSMIDLLPDPADSLREILDVADASEPVTKPRAKNSQTKFAT